MPDKPEKFLTEFVLLFELLSCAQKPILPHIQYDNCLKAMKNSLNAIIFDNIVLGLQ